MGYAKVSICGKSSKHSHIAKTIVSADEIRIGIYRNAANMGCNYARSGAHTMAETFLFFANLVHEIENLTTVLQKLLDVEELVSIKELYSLQDVLCYQEPFVAKEAKSFLILDNPKKQIREEYYRIIRRITEMELSPVYRRFHLKNRQDTEGFKHNYLFTTLSEKLWYRGYHQASDDCVRYGTLVEEKTISAMRAAQYILIEMSNCAMEHRLEKQSDILLSLLFSTKDQKASMLLETIEEYLET